MKTIRIFVILAFVFGVSNWLFDLIFCVEIEHLKVLVLKSLCFSILTSLLLKLLKV